MNKTLTGVVSGDRHRTHEHIADNAARAATLFNEAGVQPGDAVGIMLRNDFAFIEGSFAAGSLGAYAVPINWHYKGDEVTHLLVDSGARVLVIHADLLPQASGAVPDGVTVLVVATPPEIAAAYSIDPSATTVPADARNWDEQLAMAAPWSQPRQPAPGAMIYTSGTTGKPKGVRRSAPAPTADNPNQAFFEKVGLRPGVRTVITGPMYHSAPNAFALAASGLRGLVVLQPRFEPVECLSMIERYGLDLVHMVPTMFVRFLRLPDDIRSSFDMSSLRHVVHAAAPCPPDVKRAMITWLGPVIDEYYGGTESGAIVACDSAEWLAHPGTVGKALPHCEVRIYDADGVEVPPGGIGEVFMRNHALPDFTYQHRSEDRAAIEHGGLISCGDIGELDVDGFLYLRDRKRDMIISGGVNIYPIEIEACLLGHPGIRDCAVFGVPDTEFGEAVAAAIELDPEHQPALSADDIRSYARLHLAGYKAPKVIDFAESLPREDSGKIFKRKLRDAYWPEGRSI